MPYGRIGGGLVVGGWGLVAASIPLSYAPVQGVGGVTGSVAAVVIGIGLAVLAVKAPASAGSRSMRAGLGLLAVGLACLAGSTVAAARLTYDPLEDLPFLVLLAGGGLVTALGMLVTQVSLLVAGGLARRLGASFFVAIAAFYLLQGLAGMTQDSQPLQLLSIGLSLVAAAVFLVACAGPGLLAIRADRRASASTAGPTSTPAPTGSVAPMP